MQDHKFKVGQTVRLLRKNIPGRAADGVYQITRAMPFDGIEVPATPVLAALRGAPRDS